MDADRSYIEAWQKRLRQEQEALDQAAQQAREQAQVCAKALVEEYGAERVYLASTHVPTSTWSRRYSTRTLLCGASRHRRASEPRGRFDST